MFLTLSFGNLLIPKCPANSSTVIHVIFHYLSVNRSTNKNLFNPEYFFSSVFKGTNMIEDIHSNCFLNGSLSHQFAFLILTCSHFRLQCRLLQTPPKAGVRYGDYFLPPSFYREYPYLFTEGRDKNICDVEVIRDCPEQSHSGMYLSSVILE